MIVRCCCVPRRGTCVETVPPRDRWPRCSRALPENRAPLNKALLSTALSRWEVTSEPPHLELVLLTLIFKTCVGSSESDLCIQKQHVLLKFKIVFATIVRMQDSHIKLLHASLQCLQLCFDIHVQIYCDHQVFPIYCNVQSQTLWSQSL